MFNISKISLTLINAAFFLAVGWFYEIWALAVFNDRERIHTALEGLAELTSESTHQLIKLANDNVELTEEMERLIKEMIDLQRKVQELEEKLTDALKDSETEADHVERLRKELEEALIEAENRKADLEWAWSTKFPSKRFLPPVAQMESLCSYGE